MLRRTAGLGLILGTFLGVISACSSGDTPSSPTVPTTGGAGGSAGSTMAGGGAGGSAGAGTGGSAGSTGGSGTAGDGAGGATGGSAGSAASAGAGGSAGSAGATTGGTTGAGTGGGAGTSGGASGSGGALPEGPLELTAIAANTTVGLEWNAQPGAEGYRIHYAADAAATVADPSLDVGPERVTTVHRGLTNGTAYHYLVTVVTGGVESAPSTEVMATPTGEWVLEELGSGSYEDVSTGGLVPRVPLEDRIHVLLFPEGYTAGDLPVFHDLATHDGNRTNDVDRWVDEIFGIEPYAALREAFVVWYLPRASNTDSAGGDSAFMVGVSGGGVTGVTSNGETATRVWDAINLHPYPPTDFSGGGFGSVRTHVASLLVFDPDNGRAGMSGLTTSLRNPADDQQRIATAFALGHGHEFTHAFSGLRDEYLEDDNSPPSNTNDLSNVVAGSVCTELPWQHLLAGGTINASTMELVGAFGRSTHGFHSELLCLLNGTHDNAAYYGGGGTLRPNDRMCNFCREITAYYVYARSSVLPVGTEGFETWKATYRNPWFSRFPFFVPEVVPQTNDVRNPEQGDPIYEACTAAAIVGSETRSAPALSGPRRSGCVIEDG